MEDSILRTHSKPADFYRDSVRHIYLDYQSGNWSPEVLKACTRTRNLVALRSAPNLIPILCQMDLRQLSIYLYQLFGGTQQIDLKHSIFTSITHLDIFDLIMKDKTQILSGIPSLPALTHLCLNQDVPPDALQTLLSDCPALHILLNLWHQNREAAARALADNPPVRDPRFVVGVYRDYWREWESGARARDEPYFWSLADDFIAQKRRGAIPGVFALIASF